MTHATELAQERRLVTLLFADIVGFTALAETLDPEELQELMGGIFRSLIEVVEKHDGTIEKFIGDAIFVIFGAPIAHEDDAERALRTALGMQRAFAQHAAAVRSRYGRDLALRIGVHTGIVVAGAVRAPAEYGVMGDTVNIAARLQESAHPGEVLVTQATFRLTNQRFSFREVGPVPVKGKEQPVLAYALTGEREVARPSVELNTPLVGRWMELSRLDLAFQSALAGRAEFVAISGEPGIGKSRLVHEFLGLLEGQREPDSGAPLVLRWNYSGVGVRAYAGFVETLTEALGIDRAAQDALERLERRVHELEPPNHEQVLRELAAFLGLRPAAPNGGDAAEVRRARYVAVRDIYAALSRERPVTLVLEDLDKADSASIDLLAFLLAHAYRAKLLVLVTFRTMPDSLTRNAPRANFTSLILDPLTPEEASRVLESVLDWVPDDLREQVVERTGGNPFFIEETLRALIESGAIVRESEGWRLVRAPRTLEVPATLHALVASRVDRLPPLARECLQYAAVIGPRFGYRVLLAAAGQPVADAVETLVDADLVYVPTDDERLRRLGRYRFKHALTQEVAYQTLLVRRRVEMHRRVAEAIEKVYAADLADFYPALAHHYAIGEVSERAAEYAEHAANAALESHANDEALRYADQAATLYERAGREDDALRALMLVASAQRRRGEFGAAVAAYQRALVIAERRDPGGASARELYAEIAETSARWAGSATLDDLDAFLDRGLALVGSAPTRERAVLLAARAFGVRRRAGATDADWEGALVIAREALAIAESLGALREVSLCLDAVGYAERELARFDDALSTHRRRVPIARTLRQNDELVDALAMVAQSESIVGSLRDAIEHASEAHELATATGKEGLRAEACSEEARARLLAGDFTGALSAGRELLDFPLRISSMQDALGIAIAAAAALADPAEQDLRDRFARLEPHAGASALMDVLAAYYSARTAEAAYAELRPKDTRDLAYPKHIASRVLLGPTVSLAGARMGAGDAGGIAMAAELAKRAGHRRGSAMATHADGLRERDVARLREALAEYERLGLAFEQALCLHDLALVLAREAAAHGEIEALLSRARALAERLGAEPLLASLGT